VNLLLFLNLQSRPIDRAVMLSSVPVEDIAFTLIQMK